MNDKIKDFFSFKTMIIMSLVKYLYVFFFVLVTLGGVLAMYTDGFFRGILFLIFGNLVLRIAFEIMILTFSIHNLLSSIEKKVG